METNLQDIKHAIYYVKSLVKWFCLAGMIGVFCGIIGLSFRYCIDYVNAFRGQHPIIIYGLPIGGLIIIFLYHKFQVLGLDINLVLESISTDKNTPVKLGPIIFISTVLTHLFGASAGRTGAALQIGGSISSFINKMLPVKEEDSNIVIMCAFAGMFTAVIGTPITGTVFAMEVISIGIFHYSAFFPCLITSMIVSFMSQLFGFQAIFPTLDYVPMFDVSNILSVTIIAICCAIMAALFCRILKFSTKTFSHYFNNDYLRIVCGGILIILITLLLGDQGYNGPGANLIHLAFTTSMNPASFLIKILLTALTLGAAYKGGEIVPSLCIGALIGNFVATLLSVDVAFGSAIGMIAFFCGVVNCPMAAIFLSIELFQSQGIIFFVLACSIAYILSGYSSLYRSQIITYSKTKTKYIKAKTK